MIFDPNTDDQVTARQKSQMRWKAIEGFNSVHGLNALARRVGIALVCSMDAKSGKCFPSELSIATKLDVHLVSVKKAKRSLRESGLIDWNNPGGPRHSSTYFFNWIVLCRCADASKERAKQIVLENRIARHKSNAAEINFRWGFNSKTPGQVIGHELMEVFANGSGSQNQDIGSHQTNAKVVSRLPDITHGTTQRNDITHLEHADRPIGDAREGCEADNKIRVTIAGQNPIEKPAGPKCGDHKLSTFNTTCHYPHLIESFKDEVEVLRLIDAMNFEAQDKAAKVLVLKGQKAARDIVFLNQWKK